MNRLVFRSLTLFIFCLSLLAARQARADSVDYIYTFGGNTFTWVLPLNPTISASNAIAGSSITIDGVSFMENGVSMTGSFDFLNTSSLGGFDIRAGGCCLVNNEGAQLYSGSESTPTMLKGTFTLTELGADGSTPIGTGTLTATLVSTPEPATILLMVIALASGMILTLFRKN